ncbi:phosphatase PAP2 family protein [Phyllobacterium sp. CCNWLW183]|uniref:phosphatase PAP2 family protein n=1 Tax=Phyllobacterium sp. CCNWLW183 TaxID=3127482 RepID=UPI0030784403
MADGLSFSHFRPSIYFLDQELAAWVETSPRYLVEVERLISAATDPIVMIPLLAIACLFFAVIRLPWLILGFPITVWALVNATLATAISLLLKLTVGRARPETALGHLSFHPLSFQDAFQSMPSAQLALASGVVMSFAILTPRYKQLFIAGGLIVCGSRIILAEHWLSDTMLGWAIGCGSVYLTALVFKARNADWQGR